MVSNSISVEKLIEELAPIGGQLVDFGEELGEELTKKVTSSTAGLVLSTPVIFLRAIRNQLSSSKAKEKFEKAWKESENAEQRENAIRHLLEEDPQFKKTMSALFVKRDYLRATSHICDEDEPWEFLDSRNTLSTNYIDLPIIKETEVVNQSKKQTDVSAPSTPQQSALSAISSSFEHGAKAVFLLGDAGSGKSSIARQFTREYALNLLGASPISSDIMDARFPVFIKARLLSSIAEDFSKALHICTAQQLSIANLTSLPSDFFSPQSEDGQSHWRVIIDGLDEIPSETERQKFLNVLLDIHASSRNTFDFLITARENSITIDRSSDEIEIYKTIPVSPENASLIVAKYAPEKTSTEIAELIQLAPNLFTSSPFFLVALIQLSLFEKELPNTTWELCAVLVESLLKKAFPDDEKNQQLARVLLFDFCEMEAVDANVTLRDIKLKTAEKNNNNETARKHEKTLRRTGIVTKNGSSYFFSHELWRSFFRACQLANKRTPEETTWRDLRPNSSNWPQIQMLIECWSTRGMEVDDIVADLTTLGDEGILAAARIASSIDNLGSEVADTIVQRMLDPWLDGDGPKIGELELIVSIAKKHPVVIELLEEYACNLGLNDAGITECIEALFLTDNAEAALSASDYILEHSDADEYLRVCIFEVFEKFSPAELPTDHLRRIAKEGVESHARLRAILLLIKVGRTSDGELLLKDFLSSKEIKRPNGLSPYDLQEISEIAGAEFIEPILKERLRFLEGPKRSIERGLTRRHLLDDIKLYSKLVNPDSANRYLLKLAETKDEHLLCEIISAFIELKEYKQADAIAQKLLSNEKQVLHSPHFLISALVKLGRLDEAKSAALSMIEETPYDLDFGHRLRVADICQHLTSLPGTGRIAEAILFKSITTPSTDYVKALISLSRIEDAIDICKDLLRLHRGHEALEASILLWENGYKDLSLDFLKQMSISVDVTPNVNIEALETLAKIDDLVAYEQRNAVSDHFVQVLKSEHVEFKRRIDVAQTYLQQQNWILDSAGGKTKSEIILIAFRLAITDEQATILLLQELRAEHRYGEHLDALCELFENECTSDRVRFVFFCTFSGVPNYEDFADRAFELLNTAESIPLEIVIEQLNKLEHNLDNKRPAELLKKISSDKKIPVSWRLGAAGRVWASDQKTSESSTINNLAVMRDKSIRAHTKISAAKQLLRNADTREERVKLVEEFLCYDHEIIAQAKFLVEQKLFDLAVGYLKATSAKGRFQLHERVDLAWLWKKLDHPEKAEQELYSILDLSNAVLENYEEGEFFVDVAQIGFSFEKSAIRKDTVRFIERVITFFGVCRFSTVKLLELAKEHCSKSEFTQVLNKVEIRLRELANSNDDLSIYDATSAIDIVDRGWVGDDSIIRAIFDNRLASPESRIDALKLLLKRGDPQEQQELFDELVTQLPESMRELCLLANLCREKGWVAKSEEIFEQAVGTKDMARDDMLALLRCSRQLGKSDIEARLLKTLSPLSDSESYLYGSKSARNTVDWIDEYDPDLADVSLPEDDAAEFIGALGKSVEEHGDLRSLNRLREIAADYNKHQYDFNFAIEELYELGLRDEALMYFNNFLNGIQEDLKDHYWTAQLATRLELHEVAIEHLLRAPQYDPDDYLSQIERALAYYGLAMLQTER